MKARTNQIGSRPQDEVVSRRWFLERMAWVSSAAAAGVLFETHPSFASEAGRSVNETAFQSAVSLRQQTELTELTISEAMTLLRRGELSPEDLLLAHMERIERFDSDFYQGYAAKATRASLLAEAARVPTTHPSSPLRGIPLAPKDNFYTEDMLTEGGSLVYQGFQPTYNATAISMLRGAGGVIIGKAQMGNLAGGRACIYGTDTPTTRNAWTPNDVEISPAGSSSGSGTVVAARMAMGALGTQTGGSVMGPGNAQGLTCLKPTFGRISLHGVIPLSYTRDHVGVMTRNALDTAVILQVLAQPDPLDPRTLGLPTPPDYVEAATPIGGDTPRLRWHTRVGLWPGFLSTENVEELARRRALVETLEGLGAEIVDDLALPDQWEELTEEPFGGSTGDPTAFFIEELRKDVRNFASRLPRFLNGMLQSADTYVKVQQARSLLLHRIHTQTFSRCDVVVGPPGGSFDGTGLPLLCMPTGFGAEERSGLPLPRGVVIGARAFGEERLLAVAAAYQAVTSHHTVRPADPVV